MKIDILKKNQINPIIQNQISELFKQLGGNKNQISLTELLDGKNQISLVYCSDKDEIIGIALMCTYKVISGKKGWIEDVVVSSGHRGKGIGRKMMNKLLEIGSEKELSEILLFTEDHRTPAINLYSDLGFKCKESRIYTRKIK
jgi:ribosomal protein S18 acetylase RimI-like enzyme